MNNNEIEKNKGREQQEKIYKNARKVLEIINQKKNQNKKMEKKDNG